MCIRSANLFYDLWTYINACLLHAGWCVVRGHSLDHLSPAASPAPCGAVGCNSETRNPANEDGAHTSRTTNVSLAISLQSESPHITAATCSYSKTHSISKVDSASNPDSPHHSASCIALDDVSECLYLQFPATRRITHCHARLRPTQAALL